MVIPRRKKSRTVFGSMALNGNNRSCQISERAKKEEDMISFFDLVRK